MGALSAETDREQERQWATEKKRTELELDSERNVLDKLDKFKQSAEQREEKQNYIQTAKRSMAREYSSHIEERLELLKIIEIVKKIEVENKYIDKMGKS